MLRIKEDGGSLDSAHSKLRVYCLPGRLRLNKLDHLGARFNTSDSAGKRIQKVVSWNTCKYMQIILCYIVSDQISVYIHTERLNISRSWKSPTGAVPAPNTKVPKTAW